MLVASERAWIGQKLERMLVSGPGWWRHTQPVQPHWRGVPKIGQTPREPTMASFADAGAAQGGGPEGDDGEPEADDRDPLQYSTIDQGGAPEEDDRDPAADQRDLCLLIAVAQGGDPEANDHDPATNGRDPHQHSTVEHGGEPQSP